MPDKECEKSPTGEHEADAYGCAIHHPLDGGTRIIIDVPCKHCGTIGSVSCDIDHNEVAW